VKAARGLQNDMRISDKLRKLILVSLCYQSLLAIKSLPHDLGCERASTNMASTNSYVYFLEYFLAFNFSDAS
jgi:hypothetical protein